MSRTIDPTRDWDELSDDEQAYLNQRTHLKAEYFRARKHMEAQRDTEDGEETLIEGGRKVEGSSEEEPSDITPEQWVQQANKEDIVAELERREIEHDPKARKDALAKLLLEHVNNED